MGREMGMRSHMRPLDLRDDPKSPLAEAVRTLRTNLQYISLDRPLQTIVVTSALPAEGKTTVAANLAVALADVGNRTIIVGADLRKPSVHQLFGGDNSVGVTSVLTGHATLDDALQKTDHPNLQLLASGPVPPNPAEMLGSQAMRSLIEQLVSRADKVIFDTPPVIAVTDAPLLAPALDGTLLVVRVGYTPKEVARQAKEQLEKVNARVLGIVANRIDSGRNSHYYYYYYGSEEDQVTAANGRPAMGRALARLFGGR